MKDSQLVRVKQIKTRFQVSSNVINLNVFKSHLKSQCELLMLSSGVTSISRQVYNLVGWRVIAATGAVYFGLYGYERLKYTERAMERRFKQQVFFVVCST